MPVAKLGDLTPDGVVIIIDWEKFRIGDSVFVPCINVAKAVHQMRREFRHRDWGLRVRIHPENNISGVRIWRIA
jgi:hypothetical protein